MTFGISLDEDFYRRKICDCICGIPRISIIVNYEDGASE